MDIQNVQIHAWQTMFPPIDFMWKVCQSLDQVKRNISNGPLHEMALKIRCTCSSIHSIDISTSPLN